MSIVSIMKKLLCMLTVWVILCGCTKTPSGQHTEQKAPDVGSEIEALIEKLAISEETAGDLPLSLMKRS